MAHASYLIGVSRPFIEGLALESQEAPEGESEGKITKAASMAVNGEPFWGILPEFLAESHWLPGGAVLVLPTREVIFRRLKLPFSDPKKIRQVLRFELESELLEDIDRYLIDQEIHPLPEGGAEVFSYLVDAEAVRASVAACRAAEVLPYRVTFSAQALLTAHPAGEGLVFQVYAGAEEAFVSCIRNGRMEGTKPMSAGLATAWSQLHERGLTSGRDIRRVLSGGEGVEAEALAPVRARLIAELEVVAEEVNLFLKIHSMGEEYRLDFYGMYGPCLQVGQDGQVRASVDTMKMAMSERRFHGILDEVHSAVPQLRSRQGVNFHRAGASWLGQFMEFRRPIMVAAALFAVWAILATGVFVARTVTLTKKRDATEAQIRGIVNRHVPGSPTVTSGVSVMRDRARKAREEGRGSARFTGYQYDGLALVMDLSQTLGSVGGVSVESLTFARDRLVITGVTPTFQATESIKSRVEAMPRYKGKSVVLTHQRSGQTISYRLSVN